MTCFVRRPLRDQRGVTLAELAVTLALFGMIMAGVLMTWSKTQEAYFTGSEIAENQQNVRAAVDFMVRELRATGRDVTVCAFDYRSPGGTGDCVAPKPANCAAKLGGGYTSCANIFAMPFAAAGASTIRIRSDRNDNGMIADTTNSSASDEGSENVIYALANPCPTGGVSACITRDDGTGPVSMVAVDVTGLTFTYYPRPGYPPCDSVPPQSPCPAFTLPFVNQTQADNIGRIHITVITQTTLAGQPINRRLDAEVTLKNRA